MDWALSPSGRSKKNKIIKIKRNLLCRFYLTAFYLLPLKFGGFPTLFGRAYTLRIRVLPILSGGDSPQTLRVSSARAAASMAGYLLNIDFEDRVATPGPGAELRL